MSLLGRYTKQPIEVEVYSIRFDEDMAPTDELVQAWQMLTLQGALAWTGNTISTPYTAQPADDGAPLVVEAGVTTPGTLPNGFRLCVSNKSQTTAITAAGFTVPARCAAMLLKVAGSWVRQARTEAVMVVAPNDMRVRTFVHGGIDGQTLKVQVAVSTSEGRVMQDEFLVKIKEV